MRIKVVGQGPAIVLIHGWGVHTAAFQPLTALLADRFRCFLVDLPGYGLNQQNSTPYQVNQLAQAIAQHTPPAIWLGWSMGGLVALHAALTLPQVRHLVMLAASPSFVRRPTWPNAVDARLLQQFATELRQDQSKTMAHFFALITLGSSHQRQERAMLQQIFRHDPVPNQDTLLSGLRLLSSNHFAHELPRLPVPSLWIGGQHDRLIPPAGLQQASHDCRHAQLVFLAQAAHVPLFGHHKTVAEAIHQFFLTEKGMTHASTP